MVPGNVAGTGDYRHPYLLKAGERSNWHRVDATEIWHHHAGAPMGLAPSADGKEAAHQGSADLAAGQRPAGGGAGRRVAGGPTPGRLVVVGCTVAPAFRFAGFELAPPGWHPGRSASGS